jgi:hypothetical protein
MQSNPDVAFHEALLDLADEPTPRNVRRYLAASLLLERAAATPPKKKGSTRWSEREQPSPSRSSR